jgi:hypothetical protein
LAKKGFEGAKNWAVENDIKEVLKQIKTYEEAFENMKDDDEAVQEKFNSVVSRMRIRHTNIRNTVHIMSAYCILFTPPACKSAGTCYAITATC